MTLAPLSSSGNQNGTESTQRLDAVSRRSETITYTDPSGKSFRLDLERTTSVRYETYDSRAKLSMNGKGAQRGVDAADLLEASRDIVASVRRLFEDMAKSFGLTPAKGYEVEEVHIELLQVQDSLTIDMDTIDTEYWSVENTAGRIVDFAKSLYAGGDRAAHLEKMVKGIDQGYGEAKEAFGGSLPDISSQTVELAKKMLQEWAAEGDAAAPKLDAVA